VSRSTKLALVLVAIVLAGLVGCAKTPEDVVLFQERRMQCDHFRGEETYDNERARFLTEQLSKYCAGTDADLARLKTKYARDPELMKSLNAYDERIE